MKEFFTNETIHMVVFGFVMFGMFFLGSKLLIQLFRYLRGESIE